MPVPSASLRGVTVATVLPFRTGHAIDWDSYRRLLDHCAAPSGIAAPAVQAIQGQFLRAEVAISGWSDRWLAYSRYDGILVTREDLEELERGAADSKAILLALHQYVETGGTLVVLGPGEVKVPASWKRDVRR